MEIRHLRYFVAVAKHLHFGKAARSLHMAQPPLSQAVQSFEKSIGFRLFERNSRRVTLTAGGEALFARAERLIAEFDKFDKYARHLNPAAQRNLHIGFGGPSSISAIPALAARLRASEPEVDVHFHPVFGSPALARLTEGELDLAFTRCPLDVGVFDFHVFDYDRLVVVVSDKHVLADRPQVALGELVKFHFVTFERDASTNTRDICEEASRHQGIGLQLTEAPDIQSMLGLIAADVGVGVLPESSLALKVGGLRVIRLDHKFTFLASALAWRKNDDSPLLKSVIPLIQETFPEPAQPDRGVYGLAGTR